MQTILQHLTGSHQQPAVLTPAQHARLIMQSVFLILLSQNCQAELRNTNASTAYANLTKEIQTNATYKEAEKLSKARIANKVAQESLEKQLLHTTMRLS